MDIVLDSLQNIIRLKISTGNQPKATRTKLKEALKIRIWLVALQCAGVCLIFHEIGTMWFTARKVACA